MTPSIRKWVLFRETVLSEMGREDQPPLVKVASAAVLDNPLAGRFTQDLGPLVELSRAVGPELVRRAADALGAPAVSYGKAALVGTGGDQEHAVALLTTVFGDILRQAVGGGAAWISSMTKRAGPGAPVDVPLAHKDALYVRSHYDGITVSIPDAPLPGELVMIAALASRGRLNARLGGLAADDIVGEDGLR